MRVQPYHSEISSITRAGGRAQAADAVTGQHKWKLSASPGLGDVSRQTTIKLEHARDFWKRLVHRRYALGDQVLDLAVQRRQEPLVTG